MGDAVFEIVIRERLVRLGNRPVDQLSKEKARLVNAKIQSKMVVLLQGEFTEEETAWFKRGRNADTHSKAKNAPVQDYRKATGLETVYGYLYLTGQTERIRELTDKGLELLDVHEFA
ncbi:MAG: ribonuclease III [Lachnospiraceae bacterium]|nr:ribonuclease III [Lachnospiraceae bacterium]